MNREKAFDAKCQGDERFNNQEYGAALDYYTIALHYFSTDYQIYYKRSLCYSMIRDFQNSLNDSEECIRLNPICIQAYALKGEALFNLNKYKEAIDTIEEGLKIDPENEELQLKLNEINMKSRENLNQGQENISSTLNNLLTSPKTKNYFKDREFISKLELCQTNPSYLVQLMQDDDRFRDVFEVMVGINLDKLNEEAKRHNLYEDNWNDIMSSISSNEIKSINSENTEKMTDRPKVKIKHTKKDLSNSSEKSKNKLSTKKMKAEEEKKIGNELYKARNFTQAIEFYNNAKKIYKKEMIYDLNKASCYFELGNYEECIKSCNEAINIGFNNSASDEKMAKAFTRQGNAYCKINQFGKAILCYEQSYMKFNDPSTKKAIQYAKGLLEQQIAQEYYNPFIADEHNEKGNKLSEEGKFVEAILEYSEGIKRNPNSSSLYFNRSHALMKVLDHQSALKDLDKCILLEKNNIKAYIKKGYIHLIKKEFNNAIAVFEKGLEIDPINNECQQGLEKARIQYLHSSLGQSKSEKLKAIINNPEMLAIINDPYVQEFIIQYNENHDGERIKINNPLLFEKVKKLISCGILDILHQ